MTSPLPMYLLVIVCGLITPSMARIGFDDPKSPFNGTTWPPGSPWPLPQQWQRNPRQMTIASSFKFTLNGQGSSCDIMEEAVTRYQRLILSQELGKSEPSLVQLTEVIVEVDTNECGHPHLDMNESYFLTINPQEPVGFIQATSVWGALRGMETFSQLVHLNDQFQFLINGTVIRDHPQFKHRGLMLDTSRHFLSMKTLLNNLDAMAYNKLNVFHWHVVDDQSFPYESVTFPNISRFGSYSPVHIYTPSDVKQVIDYGRHRGIRILPEFDSPGHTLAFGKSFPDLLTTCYTRQGVPGAIDGKHGPAEILDPFNPMVYTVMRSLFEEIKQVFPDQFIHLGMDETFYSCWESSPKIETFMSKFGYHEMNQVENHYIVRTIRNVRRMGFKYIVWQDPVDNGVNIDEDAIVEMWKNWGKSWQLQLRETSMKGNFSLLLSSPWYLNYITYGADWVNYYEVHLGDFSDLNDRFLGGEACMWGEYVDDTNIMPLLWPRASAVAERLWSNSRDTYYANDALMRLDHHTCRMRSRGIASQPITSGSFCAPFDM